MKLEEMDKAEAWSTDTILPIGWHDVEITEAKEGTSSGGYDQLELTMAGSSGTIRDWIVNIEATRGKIKQVLEAAGIEIQGGSWNFKPAVLEGKHVRVMVQEEPKYDDPSKSVRKVAAYTPLGSVENDDDIPF